MELRHLRYFLAVVRHGSFSAAAEQLGRTQQAVSKAIQQLEERLGVQLLDRDARAPRPTAFGELLLERAREIDAALGRFEADIGALKREHGGPVRWGTSPGCAGRLVAPAVLEVLRTRPGIRCVVRGGIDRELLPALNRGDLDLVVALQSTESLDPQVTAEVLGHEVYAVVAGRSHPLAAQPSVEPAELATQRWLYGLDVGGIETAVAATFDAHGLPAPVPAVESTSVEFGRAALASGEFVGVLPLALVEPDFAAGRLRRLRVPGFEWKRAVVLFRRRAIHLSSSTLVCLDALHRIASRALPAGDFVDHAGTDATDSEASA
ncbi:MAG: LysR family transcriptional regulator [Steroidobacteraceae bacterium]|nr:LysR family transcriptional regulator [Steroidobacteraceae bacterium]